MGTAPQKWIHSHIPRYSFFCSYWACACCFADREYWNSNTKPFVRFVMTASFHFEAPRLLPRQLCDPPHPPRGPQSPKIRERSRNGLSRMGVTRSLGEGVSWRLRHVRRRDKPPPPVDAPAEAGR